MAEKNSQQTQNFPEIIVYSMNDDNFQHLWEKNLGNFTKSVEIVFEKKIFDGKKYSCNEKFFQCLSFHRLSQIWNNTESIKLKDFILMVIYNRRPYSYAILHEEYKKNKGNLLGEVILKKILEPQINNSVERREMAQSLITQGGNIS